AGGDLVSSRNGDPKDVYKPNILDIHPGLEGQGKMAMTMMETMHEAGWLNKKIAYTEDNMLDRANFVRSMHKGDTWADLETNFKALTKPSFDPQTVAELDPDYAYGVVQPSSPTDHDYSAVRKEQKDNAMYGVASNVVGLIDGITDRILINRNLALQNLDFSKNAKFNTFKKYKKAIEGIGELATAKYKEYYDGELAKNPDNVFKLNKLWEEEMIDWYSQQTGISPKDQIKIDTYKAGTVILHKNDATFANIWDIDGDNRFTLSDIQLGQLTPLISDEKDANGKSIPLMDVVDKDDKIITKGKINGVILWTDFSEMVTRALTDMMTGKELRKPSDTNPVGFVVATDDEAKHAVEASGHTWDVFSDKDAILGAAVSSKPMPIGSHMLARALKLAATEHERLAKLLVDNKNSLPDAVAKFLEIMELSHVNQHVVRDFMVHIATDPMLVHEAVQMIFQVLGDKKNDAFGAITSLVPSISSASSAKDFILRAASKISDSISGIVKELKEPANKAKLDEWGINISDLTAKIMNGNKGGIIAIIGDLLAAIKATHTVKGDMLLGIIKTVLPVIAGMI
ncbi:MAG: hypothetical protein KAG91_01310, partial [Mycoplasmataceae bacterium]|nr:hypothetical protein [Mycoplasmataceae bacterium]